MALQSLRFAGTFSRNLFQWNLTKSASIVGAQFRGIKQIVQTDAVNGDSVIEGLTLASNRFNQLVKVDEADHSKSCYMCKLNLDLKHTDVLILSQYIRNDGCMLPRRITGLCKRQQKRVSTMVTMAQKAGLMSSINPPGSKKDPRSRYKWKKWNSYWDETTIKC